MCKAECVYMPNHLVRFVIVAITIYRGAVIEKFAKVNEKTG
jgi:hypothetical protein